MSNPPTPEDKHFDLTKREVEDYFKKAEDAIIRTDQLLMDHYSGANPVGPEILQRFCELHALASSFQKYLGKTFNLEDVPDTAIFRIKEMNAIGIIKLIFAIFEAKVFLSNQGYSLEDQ